MKKTDNGIGPESQDIEAMSLKKAMISFNTKAGDAKDVLVEWKSRKGNISFYKYNLPYVTILFWCRTFPTYCFLIFVYTRSPLPKLRGRTIYFDC